jgi:hypothetical protein
VSDLAEKILAAIAADENAASNEARGWETGSRYEGQPIRWAHHVQRWTVDRVRARCAADREIVEEYLKLASVRVEVLSNWERGHREGLYKALERLARGYGIQPTPGGDHA